MRLLAHLKRVDRKLRSIISHKNQLKSQEKNKKWLRDSKQPSSTRRKLINWLKEVSPGKVRTRREANYQRSLSSALLAFFNLSSRFSRWLFDVSSSSSRSIASRFYRRRRKQTVKFTTLAINLHWIRDEWRGSS
jgi:hypothetical protein